MPKPRDWNEMARKPKEHKELSKAELDEQINESLKETFPASDPPSIGHPTRLPPENLPIDRRPRELGKKKR